MVVSQAVRTAVRAAAGPPESLTCPWRIANLPTLAIGPSMQDLCGTTVRMVPVRNISPIRIAGPANSSDRNHPSGSTQPFTLSLGQFPKEPSHCGGLLLQKRSLTRSGGRSARLTTVAKVIDQRRPNKEQKENQKMNTNQTIRAWKDEEYRLSLTDAERALLPQNPVGAIELTTADLSASGRSVRNGRPWFFDSHSFCHSTTQRLN